MGASSTAFFASASARAGSLVEAEALVREALEILAPTDAVLFRYGALIDLAEIQQIAGSGDVQATLLDAQQLADAKDSPVMFGAVEAMLAAAAGGTLVP